MGVSVTNITLDREALALVVGSAATLNPTVSPNDANNRNLVWNSSNGTVARVDNGIVTALSAGTTVITVATRNGGVTATANVEVFGVTDAGVEIGGIRWATRNVAIPGAFAHNREDAGMFFQWNTRIGWSSTNPLVNYNGGTTWSNANAAGTSWAAINDPCPAGWRVPYIEELNALRNVSHNWAYVSGVWGRTFGSMPNQLFLPAAGVRDSRDGSLGNEGWGMYWSNTQSGNNEARFLVLMMTSVFMGDGDRAAGQSVRCVAIGD